MTPSTRFPSRTLALLAAALLAGGAISALAQSSPARETIRINVGASEEHKDSAGHVWKPEKGFVGGDVIERDSDLKIANTSDTFLYLTEHYSMDSFSQPVPNGKYTVKLYFAETYEGIDGVGQRVFSMNVEGHEFKDFDVCAKAGGVLKAYVLTVDVEVTDGKLDIAFTSKIENPEINGIEIIPAS